MMWKQGIAALLLGFCFLSSALAEEEAATVTREAAGVTTLPYGKIEPELVKIGYSGAEYLRYEVFWTGGVKIGELEMDILASPKRDDEYEIDVRISTRGSLMEIFYPVRDRHLTRVAGEKKLPRYSETWQQEGSRYRAYRETVFDQQARQVTLKKNGKIQGVYSIEASTNNEFSAFLNSRLMPFTVGRSFIVPTFADKKRIPVKVTPIRKERLTTVLGEVESFVILPQLTFKGLYDKQGDTMIWYSADECRVPVKVQSKIVIGSLTARLSGYENRACRRYPAVYSQQKKVSQKEKR